MKLLLTERASIGRGGHAARVQLVGGSPTGRCERDSSDTGMKWRGRLDSLDAASRRVRHASGVRSPEKIRIPPTKNEKQT
ncbi:MAG TPA: hypothetical protein VN887_19360 [Candidatus Angelobacter sp.]|nr:hypothetical protein [Candidatus Angelobacter sp.]